MKQILCLLIFCAVAHAGYKKHEGKYCQPQSLGKFPTFDEARDECSKLEECSMFGEKIIRGSSQGFYLCGSPATEASTSSGATLYTKEEEILDTTGYKIHEGKYCQPQSLGKFPTFDEARDECSKLEECLMFGEKIIRGSSQGFYLCGSPAIVATTSSGATLYTKEENPCAEKTCSSHGSCSVDANDKTDGYLCTCSVGYTGNDCENNPCTEKTCSSHGSCSVDAGDTTDGYLCTCSVGYTGNDCEYDPCTEKTCSSHGSCSVDAGNTTDGYLCTCSVDYTGNDCEHEKLSSLINRLNDRLTDDVSNLTRLVQGMKYDQNEETEQISNLTELVKELKNNERIFQERVLNEIGEIKNRTRPDNSTQNPFLRR